jgi:hypothetical protein
MRGGCLAVNFCNAICLISTENDTITKSQTEPFQSLFSFLNVLRGPYLGMMFQGANKGADFKFS